VIQETRHEPRGTGNDAYGKTGTDPYHRSPTPTHSETTFISRDVSGTHSISPSPSKVAIHIANEVASIEPLSPVPVNLDSVRLRFEMNKWTETYIFLAEADETITRPYSTDKVELTPCRMSLGFRSGE
jgi:hypothetical protein